MTEPVILINPFTVPTDRFDEYRTRFGEVMDQLANQPGFLGGGLHVALDAAHADFPFINYNRWASEDAFHDALGIVDPERAFGALNQHIRARGTLYRVDPRFRYGQP